MYGCTCSHKPTTCTMKEFMGISHEGKFISFKATANAILESSWLGTRGSSNKKDTVKFRLSVFEEKLSLLIFFVFIHLYFFEEWD